MDETSAPDSPEGVALSLVRLVFKREKRPDDGDNYRKYVLDLYVECLKAARGERGEPFILGTTGRPKLGNLGISNSEVETASTFTRYRGKYAGKGIFPLVDGNPRKLETFGFRSYEIVRENPGILYENYRIAGGRWRDLDWDIKHNFAEVK